MAPSPATLRYASGAKISPQSGPVDLPMPTALPGFAHERFTTDGGTACRFWELTTKFEPCRLRSLALAPAVRGCKVASVGQPPLRSTPAEQSARLAASSGNGLSPPDCCPLESLPLQGMEEYRPLPNWYGTADGVPSWYGIPLRNSRIVESNGFDMYGTPLRSRVRPRRFMDGQTRRV